jgi:hypothetical protein
VLVENILQHEKGPTLGHYKQYTDTLADNDSNPGLVGESLVAGVGMSLSAFTASVNAILTSSVQGVKTSTTSEGACNSDVRNDTNCTLVTLTISRTYLVARRRGRKSYHEGVNCVFRLIARAGAGV